MKDSRIQRQRHKGKKKTKKNAENKVRVLRRRGPAEEKKNRVGKKKELEQEINMLEKPREKSRRQSTAAGRKSEDEGLGKKPVEGKQKDSECDS